MDDALDEILLARKIQDNDFIEFDLTNVNSITLNTQAISDSQVITKPYVDQFHQRNERSRQDLGIDIYSESSDSV